MNTSGIIAGCSACACGIKEACPTYVSPIWWVMAAVLGGILILVGLSIVAERRKGHAVTKNKKRLLAVAAVVAVLVVAGVVGKMVYGKMEWQRHMDEYRACEERFVHGGTACEF